MSAKQYRGHTRRQLIRNAAVAGAGVVLSSGIFKHFGSTAYAATQAFDVVVIGSGAAGMTAALTAAKRGLRVVVIEKADKFGGSTARSGAGIWIRNNEVILAEGVPDSPAKAAAYLAQVVGEAVPKDRQAAFLDQGPRMITFVMQNSPLRFRWMEGYSDYYPELEGGMPNGASIEPEMIDGRILGDELENLNPPYLATPPGVVVYGGDYKWLNLATVNLKGTAVAAKGVGRYVAAKAKGEIPLTMGQALAAGLRAGLQNAGVPVWLKTPMLDLELDSTGRVIGVVVSKDGVNTRLLANRAVIMGSGGFEHNDAMRHQYQRHPIGTEWTVGAKSNTGDGIQAGERIGAALDLMDDAWWGPSIPLTPGQPYFCLAERTLPGSILVNGQGQRFVNEGAPYTDVVHRMYDLYEGEEPMDVWLITDQNYRNRYLFRDVLPALPLPKEWYESGAVHKEWSLEKLAAAINVPRDNLEATVKRFNGFAKTGVDEDFQRGASVYDRYYTDPAVKPNSSLGSLWLPPYYAFKIVPGDLGTKGGLLTDARARVLRKDGSVIPGLYAAGNVSAAVMGRSYAGAGSTIGPAMTFGFVAGNDC